MKINFNLDDHLPLNKKIEINNVTMVKAVSHENNKYYPRTFLDK